MNKSRVLDPSILDRDEQLWYSWSKIQPEFVEGMVFDLLYRIQELRKSSNRDAQ